MLFWLVRQHMGWWWVASLTYLCRLINFCKPGLRHNATLGLEDAETLRQLFLDIQDCNLLSHFLAAFEEIRSPRIAYVTRAETSLRNLVMTPEKQELKKLEDFLKLVGENGSADHQSDDEVLSKLLDETLSIWLYDAREDAKGWLSKWRSWDLSKGEAAQTTIYISTNVSLQSEWILPLRILSLVEFPTRWSTNQDKRGNPWVVRLLLTDTNVPQHLHRTRAIMYSLPISSRGIPVTVSNKYQWHIPPVYIIRRGHCGGQYPSTLETESLHSSRATDFFSLCISHLCNDNSTYCRFCTDYRAWDGSGFSFNIESGLVWHWDKFGGIVYCWISCAVCSVEPHMVESIKMDILSVILPPSVFELFKVGLWCHPAFYGIIDLLSVMPYYIELLLQQDTVSSFALSGSSLNNVPQSILFRFSILRMFRLLRVFRPFRYTHTILLWVS